MDLSTFNSIALAGLVAFILINIMGLLGGNAMPVEGKVRKTSSLAILPATPTMLTMGNL
jgi:hypothetical protein